MSSPSLSAVCPWPGTLTQRIEWIRALVAALAALTLGAALWSARAVLSDHAAAALAVFGLALIAWTVLRWDETPVAIGAGLALVGLGVATPQAFYASLGDELVWLLAGAFVLAAAWQSSGLAERWALRAVARAATAAALLQRLTWIVIATAFVIPSTSGRAALLLPVFLALARALTNSGADNPSRAARIVRAMALLFPTVILLSACASLLGAGAHLVAVDFMRRLGHGAPSFLGWIALAAPFGIVSSLVACFVISRLFLGAEDRSHAITLPASPSGPITPAQRGVVVVTLLTLLAWATTALHGLDAAVVALLGALAVTCKPLTGLDLKTALKKVEWNLLLFMAATLVMGEALLDSGAARALADALVGALPIALLGHVGTLALASLAALLSHLLITSRTARAMVLIPTVALPLAASGVNPALLIFVTVVGSGFCQTLAVSAKPVALFAKAEWPTYGDADLLRLSMALLPLMAALLLVFALGVWPLQGLA